MTHSEAAPPTGPKRRSTPPTTESGGPPAIAYQPALDGLRGVAVIAVLLFHGGVTSMRGGFLGVDLFFVLSGYLITTLLLVEWGRTGHIELAAFWLRRARRLLPALALVLVGILLFGVAFADSSQLATMQGDALSSLAYVANWRFVFSGQSYFSQFSAPSPFRHMWSLAIEEQFYLVWPFVVLMLLRSRPRLLFLARVFAGAAVASALLMAVLVHPNGDPSRVYYGTDTRAQALLVGAALAALMLSARQRGAKARIRPVAWVRAGTVGFVVLAALLVRVSATASWMYRGGYLLAALAAAAVIAAGVQPRRNLVRAALSPAPLRAVGKVSYGLYLWHWPIFLAMTEQRVGLSGTPLLAARLLVTAALAIASYYAVELPIRHGRWPRPPRRALVLVPAIAAVLALGFVIVPAVRGTNPDTAVAVPPVTGTTVPGALPARVLLVGDSVAKTLGDGFDREAHTLDVSLLNRGRLACGLAEHATIHHGGQSAPSEPTCDDWPAQWKTWAQDLAPNVSVVIFDVYVVQDIEVGGKALTFNTPASDRYLLKQLDRGVQALLSNGAPVALVTSPYNHRPEIVGQPVRWDEDDPARIDHWNALLKRFVKDHPNDAVRLIDLNHYLSPKGAYTNVLDGVTLRYDGVHFNPEAGVLIFRWLAPQLPGSTTSPTTLPGVTTTTASTSTSTAVPTSTKPG